MIQAPPCLPLSPLPSLLPPWPPFHSTTPAFLHGWHMKNLKFRIVNWCWALPESISSLICTESVLSCQYIVPVKAQDGVQPEGETPCPLKMVPLRDFSCLVAQHLENSSKFANFIANSSRSFQFYNIIVNNVQRFRLRDVLYKNHRILQLWGEKSVTAVNSFFAILIFHEIGNFETQGKKTKLGKLGSDDCCVVG
jgi:hypothetical protein